MGETVFGIVILHWMHVNFDWFLHEMCSKDVHTSHDLIPSLISCTDVFYRRDKKNICDVCIFLYRDNSTIKNKPTSIWSLSKWLNIWFGMIVLCETAERKCDKSICVRMHAQLSKSQHIAANWEIENTRHLFR